MSISAEHRPKFEALHRHVVTSPYEWNIIEWDVKQHQTNKQIFKIIFCVFVCFNVWIYTTNTTCTPISSFACIWWSRTCSSLLNGEWMWDVNVIYVNFYIVCAKMLSFCFILTRSFVWTTFVAFSSFIFPFELHYYSVTMVTLFQSNVIITREWKKLKLNGDWITNIYVFLCKKGFLPWSYHLYSQKFIFFFKIIAYAMIQYKHIRCLLCVAVIQG